MTAVIDAVVVDSALAQFREMMATDGYLLSWSPADAGRILIRIDASPEACADCLVPAPVFQAMMTSALADTPYEIANVILPTEGH